MASAMNNKSRSYVGLPTLALIVALASFYNSELLMPDSSVSINYHVVYLFGTLSTLMVILLTVFVRISLAVTFIASGLACVLTTSYLSSGSAIPGIASQLYLFPSLAVAGITTLTHWYVRKLRLYLLQKHKSEDGPAAMRFLEDELDHIKYEFARARRYNHHISVILIRPITASQRKIDKDRLASSLDRNFRRTERLYDMGKSEQYLIFCPETTISSAEMLVNRIRIMTQRERDIYFHYGIATFPDQEVTFEGLLSRAQANLQARFRGKKSSAVSQPNKGKLAASG